MYSYGWLFIKGYFCPVKNVGTQMNISRNSLYHKFYFAFIILLVFNGYNLYAQPKFSAIASANKLGRNERLQVDFRIDNPGNIEQLSPPKFPGFIVESGPNQQSGMSTINGNVSQYIAISYILRAGKKGRLTIGPARASMDGKIYQTASLNIEVTENATGNSINPYSPFSGFDVPEQQPVVRGYEDYILKPGENIREKVSKNMFVKVDVNKTSCFVGEPVVATYKLYTRLKSESNLTKSPSFNGFSVTDLEIGNNYELRTEKLGGRDYSVYILRKVQLYPLQPGTAELESCEVENEITFLKGDYANARNGADLQELLYGFAQSTIPPEAIQLVKVSLASKPVQITINPLPEEGKPAGFKGAVGEFKMTSWLVNPRLSTDDAGSLRIDLYGAGNIHLINGPGVSMPDGIENFEPRATETINKNVVPVTGEKQYAYPFTISRQGNYIIAPIEFSYFDLKSKSYKTLRSEPISLNVSKGKGKKPVIPSASGTTKEESSSLLGLLLWIAAGIAVIVLITFVLLNRNSKKKPAEMYEDKLSGKPVPPVLPVEPIIPVSPLIVPQQKLMDQDPVGFFTSLNRSMKQYLSKRLQVPIEELNKKRINEALDKKGVNVHTSQLVSSLIDDIELNVYASPSMAHAEMQDVFEKANEVLGLLDKQLVATNR